MDTKILPNKAAKYLESACCVALCETNDVALSLMEEYSHKQKVTERFHANVIGSFNEVICIGDYDKESNLKHSIYQIPLRSHTGTYCRSQKVEPRFETRVHRSGTQRWWFSY